VFEPWLYLYFAVNERICYTLGMSTTTLTTADELLTLPMGMGKRYELVLGELRVMSPGGWKHGNVISNIHGVILDHVRRHKLGMMFGAETGFKLTTNPDTVRAPDVAFVRRGNVPTDLPERGYWPGAPDLAVEVISPNDTSGEVDEKIAAWLAAGCVSVWVVDPQLETVTIYYSRKDVVVRAVGEVIGDEPLLPGFSCNVEEIFA
jgi:Uma2 family endonuclease